MSLRIFHICLGAVMLCFLAVPVSAQEVKDSYYFMKDDGEFSPEEKDEEAQYIYEQCEQNTFQSLFFDCACIAGAFRQERDKEKLIPQANLLNSLFEEDNQRGCANVTAMAGDTYKFCQSFVKAHRQKEKNNEQYCECVANTVARNFAKKPRLSTRFQESLTSEAMISCGKKI
ncbi:MAG TPA: hypothetical protein PLF01_00065 [Alphaproteobacteria bacterium]|nr:hypothetical protein [Alphaproteobacteria bacterium]